MQLAVIILAHNRRMNYPQATLDADTAVLVGEIVGSEPSLKGRPLFYPPANSYFMRRNPIDRFLVAYYRARWRGFISLNRVLAGGKQEFLASTRYNSFFRLSLRQYIDSIVLREGYYESEVFEAIRAHLSPTQGVLWDVGANFGLHSVTAAVVIPDAQVIAFEPCYELASRLRENAKLNEVKVEVVNLALGATDGARKLYVIDQGNSGMTTLVPWSKARYDRIVTVECKRGDELVANGSLPMPTVVKIDVEGAEEEVFRGMRKILKNPSLRAVIFEAEPGLDSPHATHFIAMKLRELGFQISRLQRQESTEHFLQNYVAARNHGTQ